MMTTLPESGLRSHQGKATFGDAGAAHPPKWLDVSAARNELAQIMKYHFERVDLVRGNVLGWLEHQQRKEGPPVSHVEPANFSSSDYPKVTSTVSTTASLDKSPCKVTRPDSLDKSPFTLASTTS